jgi:hypothetical protein
MQHFFVAHLVSVFHLGPFASVDTPYSTTHHFESHPFRIALCCNAYTLRQFWRTPTQKIVQGWRMLFNSYIFIFGFLPVVWLGFYQIGKSSHAMDALWLAAASLFFYGWWALPPDPSARRD